VTPPSCCVTWPSWSLEENALPLDQWRDALFERLPRDDLVAAMAEVDAIARPRDAKPYAELLARWRRARRLFFNIATRLEMDAAPGGKAVQEAIRYLAKIADWSHAKMRDAPITAVPKAWQQHVLDSKGRAADPRAYVFAIIDAWRAAVKRRDIFASSGTRYGDPRRGMRDGATWQASKLVVCRALNRSLDAETEIAALSQLVDGACRTAAGRAASNPDLRFETVDGKTRIVVTPLDRLEDTESLRALRPAVRPPAAGDGRGGNHLPPQRPSPRGCRLLSDDDARTGGIHPSLPAACPARGLSSHPPLRAVRPHCPQGQHRPRPPPAGRAPSGGGRCGGRRRRCGTVALLPVLRRSNDHRRNPGASLPVACPADSGSAVREGLAVTRHQLHPPRAATDPGRPTIQPAPAAPQAALVMTNTA